MNPYFNSVCDECCLPLTDYGYVAILIPDEDGKSILRELCDLCAANLLEDEFDEGYLAVAANRS